MRFVKRVAAVVIVIVLLQICCVAVFSRTVTPKQSASATATVTTASAAPDPALSLYRKCATQAFGPLDAKLSDGPLAKWTLEGEDVLVVDARQQPCERGPGVQVFAYWGDCRYAGVCVLKSDYSLEKAQELVATQIRAQKAKQAEDQRIKDALKR